MRTTQKEIDEDSTAMNLIFFNLSEISFHQFEEMIVSKIFPIFQL